MASFEMNGVDLKRLQLAHQILADVVDRLVEIEDIELEIELEPLTKTVEIDGVTPHNHYYYDRDCCEGMDW